MYIQRTLQASFASLKGIQYYVHPRLFKVSVLRQLYDSQTAGVKTIESGFSPATLIRFDEDESVTLKALEEKIQAFSPSDDVFCHDFLECMIIAAQPHQYAAAFDEPAKDSWGRPICHPVGLTSSARPVSDKHLDAIPTLIEPL